MYLCRCYTEASLKQIGRAFHRDHTSVLHAVRVVERRNLEQAQHRYELEALAGRLGCPAPKARP
jgi:chromosomal replication initiation ATPase DnaA